MLNKKHNSDMPRVPLWKKMNLTVEEAAERGRRKDGAIRYR